MEKKQEELVAAKEEVQKRLARGKEGVQAQMAVADKLAEENKGLVKAAQVRLL